MFWTEWELSNVLGAIFSNNKDVVFTVATCPRFAFHDGDHGFHGNSHAWVSDGVKVVAQRQTSFAPIVVRQYSGGVAVTKGTVWQKTVSNENFIEFVGDVLACSTWFDQLQPGFMDLDVSFPQF